MHGQGTTGVAIVGAGRMGAAHARAWAALQPEVEVLAVVGDGLPRPLEDAPRARATTDLGGVLADPAVSILSITTPTDTHLDLAARALDAGKHVLLEKPLARTAAEGEELVRLAGRGPGLLMVAQVVRFFPGYVAVRRLVADGALGTIRTVRAERLSAGGGRPAWLDDEERSGGVLVDLAVHDFDQVLLLLGPAARVRATADADGSVEVAVEHVGGGTSTVRAGWDLPPEAPFRTLLEVTGDLGRARHAAVAGAGGSSTLEVTGPSGSRRTAVVEDDPYAAQARSFLEHVRAGTPPEHGDPAASLAALRLALAARAALASGRPADVG